MIKNCYQKAWQAKQEGQLVCWHLAGVPSELLRAMGIVPIFSEGFAGQMAAKGGAAMKYLMIAESSGYGRDS
jgi:hypothetical protein